MIPQYKGSTFGKHYTDSNAANSSTKKRSAIVTNPLNPWFLSNGIPDFSPQIDKNYEILTMKRKVALFEDQEIHNSCCDDTTNSDTINNTAEEQVQHITKKNRCEGAMESKPAGKLASDDDTSGVLSPTQDSEEKVIHQSEKSEDVSVAHSLLNSIKNEKVKAKALEDKIMNSFDFEKKK